jgi:hypothetical protein
MTQDQFNSWLENPSMMDAQSITQLREITIRYPFYQTAQIMLAKNLKDVNHIDQLNQVQLAAIMAPDRKLFRDYLCDKTKLKITEKAEVEVEDEQSEAEETEPRFPDELIQEPIIYQLETAELPELPIAEDAEEMEETPEPSELSFSEWLDYTSSDKTPEQRTLKTKKPKLAQSNIELIDHFLTQQADSPRKRAEFFNPQKVAAKSQEEDFTVVSETLAKIYTEQEKYSLATQAYEALSLKYPEKSVYFAARLKDIAEKQNSEK